MRATLFLLVRDFSSAGESGMAMRKPAREAEIS